MTTIFESLYSYASLLISKLNTNYFTVGGAGFVFANVFEFIPVAVSVGVGISIIMVNYSKHKYYKRKGKSNESE